MEGPTLQQDVGAVLGFATSVVVVTGLWISFVRPVANAYQKIAKNIYSLLPKSGVVPEDNGHDTTRKVFFLRAPPAAANNGAQNQNRRGSSTNSGGSGARASTRPAPSA